MRQSRFTEAQIIGMIKEQEAGQPTADVCRKHGLSPGTFYWARFTSTHRSMAAWRFPTLPRCGCPEDENAKLKRHSGACPCQWHPNRAG